jgi:hypothetical protein
MPKLEETLAWGMRRVKNTAARRVEYQIHPIIKSRGIVK